MLTRRFLLLLTLFCGVASPVAAQTGSGPVAVDGPRVVVYGSDVDAGTRVGVAPAAAPGAPAAVATATFSVNYTGFTTAARTAFQAAVVKPV